MPTLRNFPTLTEFTFTCITVCMCACLCVKGFINVFLVFFYALFLHFPVCHWLSYIHTSLAAVYNLTLHIGFTASALCYVNTIALLTLPKCHHWLLWWIRNELINKHDCFSCQETTQHRGNAGSVCPNEWMALWLIQTREIVIWCRWQRWTEFANSREKDEDWSVGAAGSFGERDFLIWGNDGVLL